MSWLGSLLGDVPIIGDAINFIGGNYQNNRNQHFQHDESAISRQWQTDESQKARDWQSRENEVARNWQAAQWNTQFQAQNEEYERRLQSERAYNDPLAQARRLASAGINPASMSGDQTGGTSFSAPESPSLSAPSVQGAPSASPVGAPGTNSVPVPNLSQSIAALSQANFNEAQADRIYSLLEGDLYLQGIEKGMKDIEYDIASLTKDHKVMDAYYTYQDKVSRIILNDEMTYTEQRKQLLFASEEFLNYASGGVKHEEMNFLRMKVSRFNEVVNADLKLKDAQARESRARAGLDSTLQVYYGALSREVDWLNDVKGEADENNPVFRSARNRIIAEANKIIREGNLTKEQIREVQEKVDLLEKENNIYYAKQISNELKDYLGIAADVYRTSTMQNFFNTESSRRREKDLFDMEHYGDVLEEYEETRPTYSGKSKHKVSRKRKSH